MYFRFLTEEFTIISEVILDIEYFNKEDYIDKFFLLVPSIIGLFALVTCVFISFYTRNILVYSSIGVLLCVTGVALSLLYLNKYIKTSKLTINTRELYFWVNGSKYYFSDLMPTYEVKMSNPIKSSRWYDITLYFKNGSTESLFLSDKKALAFMNKYLSVYSKPVKKELISNEA